MNPTLRAEDLRETMARLARANAEFAARHPGESGRRQPVHTVYGGAHLFRADTARRLGELARQAMAEFAPDAPTFARALEFSGEAKLTEAIYRRVREKLEREPVEDFRIDFEDGYGNRSDAEEDGHAASAAEEVAAGLAGKQLPPFIGIRIKPLSEELRERSLRTMDIFLTTVVKKAGRLPENFVVTLPKIVHVEQVTALADVFDRLEPPLGLTKDSLRMELMVETPQSILNEEGQSPLPMFVEAARGRCVAAHFGTYDYTASVNITAAHQHMNHPACDFARQVMQVSLAGRGVWLSDGATNVMPVPPHRPAKDGAARLGGAQVEENRAVVWRAWRLQREHIQHSLELGFYQGWDLHPAQLPVRYASVYAFFLESLDAASERLRNFVAQAAKATLVGDVFDDAATGQGLLNYFLRAINCGAITEAEAQPLTGLTLEELRMGSFVKILKKRQDG